MSPELAEHERCPRCNRLATNGRCDACGHMPPSPFLLRNKPLMYADLNPDSYKRYPIKPTAEAIHAAERRGLVAPDAEVFARRAAILDSAYDSTECDDHQWEQS